MSTAISQNFFSGQDANAAAVSLTGQELVVTGRNETILEDAPPPPYTTAALLEDADRRWNWTSERAMKLAQALFEGGWITYPRTDSTRLSPSARDALRQVVAAHYGSELLAPKYSRKHSPTNKVSKRSQARQGMSSTSKMPGAKRLLQKLWERVALTEAQPATDEATAVGRVEDAHEAIRPTDPSRIPDELDDQPQRLLYELICQRSLASQMRAARYKLITVHLEEK